MTLDELIAALKAMPQDRILQRGFRHPHSYRGYYDQLAFEPAENVLVADMLVDAESALDHQYTGYKGGEFTMHGWTDVWLARYGTTGEPLTPSTLELWSLLGSSKSEKMNEYTFEVDSITVNAVDEAAAWALLQDNFHMMGRDDPKLYASLVEVKSVKVRCPEHGAPDVGTGYYECGCAV